jgi:glucuronoarabinoxylan endo-1,4-beta-xylanase
MAQGMKKDWKLVCGRDAARLAGKKFTSPWLAIAGLVWVLLFGAKVQAQTATVSWTSLHQTIDGFGASDWGTAESLSPSEADTFFSTTVSGGAGLSFVRTLGNEECSGTVSDLTTLREAVARGAQVWLTMQSPPVSMKDSGACSYGNLLTADYGAYANFIVDWIKQLQGDGIPIYAVSPVNEPDVACDNGGANGIGAFCFTPAQIDTFVKSNLGPALQAAGLSTKIILSEEGQWFFHNYASTCMADSACASYVSILAAHGYGYYPNTSIGYYDSYACCSVIKPAPEATSTNQLWQTEVSWSGSGNAFTGTISDGLVWAKNIHDYLTTANLTGWMYWMLNGNNWFNDNEGLTDENGNVAKRLYVIGNWSKFVRPGWVRIDATANPQSGVYISAFKNPADSSFAIVAINTGSSTVPQGFSLSGFPTIASVTPYETSAGANLEQQSPVTVGSTAFTYSLPSGSIVTLVGTIGASNAASRNVSPPTSLQVSVK